MTLYGTIGTHILGSESVDLTGKIGSSSRPSTISQSYTVQYPSP